GRKARRENTIPECRTTEPVCSSPARMTTEGMQTHQHADLDEASWFTCDGRANGIAGPKYQLREGREDLRACQDVGGTGLCESSLGSRHVQQAADAEGV